MYPPTDSTDLYASSRSQLSLFDLMKLVRLVSCLELNLLIESPSDMQALKSPPIMRKASGCLSMSSKILSYTLPMKSNETLWSFGQYTFTTMDFIMSFSITTTAILPSSSTYFSRHSYELSNNVITPPLLVLTQLDTKSIFQYRPIKLSSTM